jgi:hypothetical protein
MNLSSAQIATYRHISSQELRPVESELKGLLGILGGVALDHQDFGDGGARPPFV